MRFTEIMAASHPQNGEDEQEATESDENQPFQDNAALLTGRFIQGVYNADTEQRGVKNGDPKMEEK